ncbi:alpha/beta fold hydrolase [Nocardia macrotermitis]|uniref:AB hydrolase superfamily protein YdjP n=1 Tax=Nocardia macrotermitis TaxID=2585198 RepID=A0A7K0CUQ6_9NOCA|nr:alpha/beta fold hydrolase [Nocardia macrotermitis]MQY17123.1 AB hydrolase superfamily protein YdjP [Nocardia macrotermitis]
MPIIDIHGVPIAYTDTGVPPCRPDAATIVFGHGLLFGGWMFRPQIQALRDRFRCVTLDWRGQGETPPTPDGYDMDSLTADALGLIRALDSRPVHWVGLSMGGFVGLRLAARHGEHLRSLTLLDTSAGPEDPEHIGEYKRLARALHWFGVRPIRPLITPHLFGPAIRADRTRRAVIDEWSTRLSHCHRPAIRRAVLAVADRPTIEPELPAITLPTLVAVGADDRATPPARSHRITTLIPKSHYHLIPNSGHTTTLEQPEAVTTLLTDFLDSTASVDTPKPTLPQQH